MLDHIAGGIVLGGQRRDDLPDTHLTRAALEDLAAGVVEHEHALGGLQHPAIPRGVVLQAREAGQPRAPLEHRAVLGTHRHRPQAAAGTKAPGGGSFGST